MKTCNEKTYFGRICFVNKNPRRFQYCLGHNKGRKFYEILAHEACGYQINIRIDDGDFPQMEVTSKKHLLEVWMHSDQTFDIELNGRQRERTYIYWYLVLNPLEELEVCTCHCINLFAEKSSAWETSGRPLWILWCFEQAQRNHHLSSWPVNLPPPNILRATNGQ